MPESAVPIQVLTVDVFVIDPRPDGWRMLLMQRGEGGRCLGSWEAVHGTIESGERPEHAALREIREETGLEASRLYNVTVNPFYVHRIGVVNAAVVFAAFVDEPGAVTLGGEHVAHEWLSVKDAMERFVWPRSRVAMREIIELLGTGDAGPVEDVLRVPLPLEPPRSS